MGHPVRTALFGAPCADVTFSLTRGLGGEQRAAGNVEKVASSRAAKNGSVTEKEALMATLVTTRKSAARKGSIPRAIAARVEEILATPYAFMDSPIFKQRNIEKELFTF